MGCFARLAAVLLAVCVSPVVGQNPLAPNASGPPAQNPLAQKPPALPNNYAGEFAGDGVTLRLGQPNAAGEQTGVLTVKGTDYPCSGVEKDGVFAGKFTVGQETFDFRLEGGGQAGATLESAGTKYQLTRKQPANPPANNNPLANGPRPAPPLDNPDKPVANNDPAPAAGPVGGVGISFAPNEDGVLVIAAILPGSPAAKAKLQPGGILRAVDGKDVTDIKPEQLRAMIGGKPGTMVKLTIETDDEVMTVFLERADLSKLMPPPQPPRRG